MDTGGRCATGGESSVMPAAQMEVTDTQADKSHARLRREILSGGPGTSWADPEVGVMQAQHGLKAGLVNCTGKGKAESWLEDSSSGDNYAHCGVQMGPWHAEEEGSPEGSGQLHGEPKVGPDFSEPSW